jgi:hypothetical protein
VGFGTVRHDSRGRCGISWLLRGRRNLRRRGRRGVRARCWPLVGVRLRLIGARPCVAVLRRTRLGACVPRVLCARDV